MTGIVEITPEIGVPLPKDYSYADLKIRVEAACNTAEFLLDMGAEKREATQQDKEEAAKLACAYAANEEAASKNTSNSQLGSMSTEAIIYARSILDEYGHRVADSAQQIRNLVTTKLLQETENADPKVRLKALELLGKISDVGLFSEKTEVTVTHQTSDDLKKQLKVKLEKLINPPARIDPKTQAARDRAEREAVLRDEDPDTNFDIEDAEYEEVNNG